MTGPRLTELTDRGGIDVSGSERIRWLDGMVTQDVAGLSPGDVAPALVLTHQGRIVSDVWMWVFADHLHLDLAAAAVSGVLEHLERFIIADDVTLTDVSPGRVRFTVEGAGAGAAVSDALGLGAGGLDAGGVAEVEVGGVAVTVAAHGMVEESGVQLRVAADAAEEIRARLLEAGIAEVDAEAFEEARIARGIPWYGKELDTSVLPAEVRLDRAISTTKGCYAGQEVVARMRSRGRVANLLVSLHFDADGGVPDAGSELAIEGRKVGELTSIVAREGGALGLGFVKSAHAEPGTRVEVGSARARIAEPGAG